jgi:hypothetical protein
VAVGLDFFILGVWLLQALVVIVLAALAVLARRWLGAAALIVGAFIGFSPLAIPRNPGEHPAATVFGGSIILVLVSVVVLALAYSIRRRWMALAACLVLLGIPAIYILNGSQYVPPSSSPALLGWLEFLGELSFFFAPIASALALQEVVLAVSHLTMRLKERTS